MAREPRTLRPAIIIATLLLATGCSASLSIGDDPSDAPDAPASTTTQTYADNGVSFSYPANFASTTIGEGTVSSGATTWQEAIQLEGDPLSVITVSLYADAMSVAITPENIEEASTELTDSLTQLMAQGGGSIDSGPGSTTMGGLPALDFTGTTNAPDGSTVQARMVFAFDGTDEYYVYCQYSPTGKTQVLEACTQVVGTFQLTATSPTPVP